MSVHKIIMLNGTLLTRLTNYELFLMYRGYVISTQKQKSNKHHFYGIGILDFLP
jgi:hypothetical protein